MTNRMTYRILKSLDFRLKVRKIPENYSYETHDNPFLVTMGQFEPQVFKCPKKRFRQPIIDYERGLPGEIPVTIILK